MAKCRPKKWLPYAIPGVLLPLLAAWVVDKEPTIQAVQTRATQALSGEVAPWAKLEQDGRDFVLSGSAPSKDAIEMAVKTVAGTYGVRTISSKAEVVEPVALAAPTVNPYIGNSETPTITGTWPEVAAVAVQQNLNVKLGDTNFELGKSPELTSDGAGNWKLIPSVKLPEGKFDIIPAIVGAAGLATVAAAAPAAAIVDLTPPVAPSITPLAPDFKWPSAITGKWPEEKGASLGIKFNAVDYIVGQTPDLTSDGSGNFTFAPKVDLKPGSYDLDFSVKDVAGNVTTQTLKAAVVIPEVKVETPAVEPAPMAAPVAVVADAVAKDGVITGTYDASNPNYDLRAVFAGRTVAVGAELVTPEAGKFTFTPDTSKLAPGTYDVAFDMVPKDGKGDVVTTTLNRAITVAAPAPAPHAAPGIVVAKRSADGGTVTGTYDNDHGGHVLSVEFEGKTYEMNAGAELTSSRYNEFTFKPSLDGLAPGKYDVKFITTHRDGQVGPVAVVVPGAIRVAEPPPPPPPPAHESANPVRVESTGSAVAGSWDNSHPTHQLSAVFEGKTFVLGTDAELSAGEGSAFAFKPSTDGLAPGAYDVRFVTSHTDGAAGDITVLSQDAIVVAEPPPPPPPPPAHESANPVRVESTGSAVAGSWDNSHPTHQLSAVFEGKTFVLGTDAELSAGEGNAFAFKPSTDGLAPGAYDVRFVTSHTDGTAGDITVLSQDAIVVAEPPPPPPPPKIDVPPPTIVSQTDVTGAPIIKGTWPNTVATKLAVTVAGRTYISGQDANLSVKDGNWTLLPGASLANGVYEVIAFASDDAGNWAKDSTNAELTVDIPPPPPPPPPPPEVVPYDCVAVMNRIGNVFPIRFEYDLLDFTRPFELSVNQYAALLKDPRCTSINISVEGHADFKGSEQYNINLSQRRADKIASMLKEAGVDASRMTIGAKGEADPLDPAVSDEARAVNRRVVITAKP